MSLDVIRNAWFLTGPTAAGKSAVGVELAERIGAEIISLDSMALYRRMDIGTAKPTADERRRVPHHLIDVLEPHEDFSLAQYIEAANRAAEQIAEGGKGDSPHLPERPEGCCAQMGTVPFSSAFPPSPSGKQVLFVGGTPLYLKGLLRGIFQGPPADWQLRRRLVDEAHREGETWLHQQVANIDPASAARLHPNDTRRLIRAFEVYEKTGRPISEWQRQFDVGRPAAECRVFVLDWPKEELHARINERVDGMFAAGLVEEVRGLLSEPRPLSRTASQAVGYREVIEHLAGHRNLAETIALVKQHTRQLAKRQSTWFRSLSECQFVPVARPFDVAATAHVILDLAKNLADFPHDSSRHPE